MRSVHVPWALACILAGTMFLPGCSGPGVVAGRAGDPGVISTAEAHLSAVLLLRGWLNILYHREEDKQGCQSTWQSEELADGSTHIWGTNSDCTQFDYVVAADQSGAGTVLHPDGGTDTMAWTAPVWDGPVLSQDIRQDLRDGVHLQYTWMMDISQPGATVQTWDGSAALSDGRTMTFVLGRGGASNEDRLTLQLPDGSRLDVQVPLTAVPGALFWPVFSEGAQGTFMPVGGDKQPGVGALDFRITGTQDRWDRWQFTSSAGIEGSFALGEGFEGTGEMNRGGQLLGALRWQQSVVGVLDQVTARAAEVSPSAAARDFQVDRWFTTIAAMGPSPLY